MKRCTTCQEEVADKFSFCPVCGTSLSVGAPDAPPSDMTTPRFSGRATTTMRLADTFSGRASEAVPSAVQPTAETPRPAAAENAVRQVVPVPVPVTSESNGAAQAAGDARPQEAQAVSGATFAPSVTPVPPANVPTERDDSLHLTILEEKSLISRLSTEIGQVARNSQLTWPEFKRDPAGFVKRTASAYGQTVWSVIARPAVAVALFTALATIGVAMAAIFILERNQKSGPGMSKAATIGLALGAVMLLGGLLVAWLKRERPTSVESGIGTMRVSESGSSSNDLIAVVASLAVILFVSGFVYLSSHWKRQAAAIAQKEELELLQMVPDEIPKEEEKPVKEGNAGNNKGKGGGSLAKPAKPQGGGGGGDEKADKPVSKGETPPMAPEPQIVVPRPQPPPNRPPLLPVMPTLKGDAALTKMPKNMQFGDPDSQATETSRGKGSGEGFGGGEGTGAGKGTGAGLGPGRGENTGGGDAKYGGGGPGGGGGGAPPKPEIDYNRPFSAKEVTRKAVITGRPEPPYTEEARKNATVGTVVVRVLLGGNGSVQQASAVTRLPYGLTEAAVAAARKIRFTPAQKDGHSVSQWVQVEYSFNLY